MGRRPWGGKGQKYVKKSCPYLVGDGRVSVGREEQPDTGKVGLARKRELDRRQQRGLHTHGRGIDGGPGAEELGDDVAVTRLDRGVERLDWVGRGATSDRGHR